MDLPLCYFVLFVPFVVNFLVFCARISLIRFYFTHKKLEFYENDPSQTWQFQVAGHPVAHFKGKQNKK